MGGMKMPPMRMKPPPMRQNQVEYRYDSTLWNNSNYVIWGQGQKLLSFKI